jgi:predicted O-methyltransferase YrrM
VNTCALEQPAVAATLKRLHAAARGDWKHRAFVAPRWIVSRITGRDFMSRSPKALAKTYSSVTVEEGRLLYLIARANNAKRIVEFGCSFGVSTVYLAAAARENGGSVLTTDLEPIKVAGARENLSSAGLADVVKVLEGDALETLQNIEGPIDLLFLDGMKHLYLSVFELLWQRLRLGAVILADNVDMPSARPYANVVRSPRSGFVSSTLFGGRMELSLWNGNAT